MKFNPPTDFKLGVHVLMLIDRGVQNSNKGSKRWINKIITTSEAEWDEAAAKLIELQNYLANPDIRLYASLNCRNMSKAIKHFQHKQLDLIDDNRDNFYRRINDSFCSSLMQPENRMVSFFLLDCDTTDPMGITGWMVKNRDLKVYFYYPTPNGWHYITEPFNPVRLDGIPDVEIKKDALMLINWIGQ